MSRRTITYRTDDLLHPASFALGCLTGLLFGTVLGIMVAPHRGDVTRRKLKRGAEETRDRVVEKVEELKR